MIWNLVLMQHFSKNCLVLEARNDQLNVALFGSRLIILQKLRSSEKTLCEDFFQNKYSSKDDAYSKV